MRSDEYAGTKKEVVTDYFKVLAWYSLGRTEENQADPSYSQPQMRFKPGTS
jgi:hypothetical protein